MVLSNWSALCLAVQNSWGGPESAEKRDWFAGAVSDLIASKPDADVETQSISLETSVPEHAFWPAYAPHYTLNVPAGEMIDHNPPAHFDDINATLTPRLESFTKSS